MGFAVLLPVRYWRLTLVVIIVVLLYWQWETLVWWANGVINSTLRLFGWGLVFVAIAIGTLVRVLWRRK